MIDKFTKEFAFLSNFHPCNIELDGSIYPSVEHAFQASKTLNPRERLWIRLASKPSSAKRQGHYVNLRPNWDNLRVSVMLDLLRKKFAIPELQEQLLRTGNEILIEGNWWGDDFWGVPQGPLYHGEGKNMLGQLLMQVRREIVEGSTGAL